MSIQIANRYPKGTLIQVHLLDAGGSTCVIDGGETYSISAQSSPVHNRLMSFPSVRFTEISSAAEINKNRWDRNEMMGMLDAAHRRIDQLEEQLKEKDSKSTTLTGQYEMPL